MRLVCWGPRNPSPLHLSRGGPCECHEKSLQWLKNCAQMRTGLEVYQPDSGRPAKRRATVGLTKPTQAGGTRARPHKGLAATGKWARRADPSPPSRRGGGERVPRGAGPAKAREQPGLPPHSRLPPSAPPRPHPFAPGPAAGGGRSRAARRAGRSRGSDGCVRPRHPGKHAPRRAGRAARPGTLCARLWLPGGGGEALARGPRACKQARWGCGRGRGRGVRGGPGMLGPIRLPQAPPRTDTPR